MFVIGKRTLIDLENELLRLLNETRGSLLEDAELFSTLQTSKSTSESVKSSLETAEKTEIQIDMAREVRIFLFLIGESKIEYLQIFYRIEPVLI